MKNKAAVIAFAMIFLVLTGVLAFFFVNCIAYYSSLEVTYEELKCEKLTYKGHEVISRGQSGYVYEMFFAEYTDPFEVDNITQKKIDKKALSELKQNESITVYYCESDSSNYGHSIREMRSNAATVLSLSDYIEVNQNNQITGMVICFVMALAGAALTVYYLRIAKTL